MTRNQDLTTMTPEAALAEIVASHKDRFPVLLDFVGAVITPTGNTATGYCAKAGTCKKLCFDVRTKDFIILGTILGTITAVKPLN